MWEAVSGAPHGASTARDGRARDHLDGRAHQLRFVAAGAARPGATLAKVLLVAGVDWRVPVRSRQLVEYRGSGLQGTCEGSPRAPARGGGLRAAMLGALWPMTAGTTWRPGGRNPQSATQSAARLHGGMLVVGALYLFVNLAYFYAMSPSRLPTFPRAPRWPPRC